MEHANSLEILFPQLSKEWDAVKNNGLTPDKVAPHSHKRVWWRCSKGHSWNAPVSSRTAGCGCPVCANRVILAGYNDLASNHPQLAAQWHPTKNRELTPEQVGAGYDKKVWWMCEKGHEWQAAVKTRVRESSGCPVCANYVALAGYNDLATTHPLVAAQWHPEKNGNLSPEQVVAGSKRYVWWRCSLGHEWRAKVVDRTRGTNSCPYCSNQKVLAGFNDLATTHPDVAVQWHPALNGDLTPQQVTAGSTRRIWWICPEGHIWRTAVYNRAGKNKQTGCPVCAGNYKVAYRQEQYKDMLSSGQRDSRRTACGSQGRAEKHVQEAPGYGK